MRQLVGQPLLQFLLLGVVLFAAWSRIAGGRSGSEERIVVGEAQVLRLAERFQQTWRRPPTDEELRGLVDDFVKEEVYYREALAMGLDRDDEVIRRRLRQKVELLSEDVSQSVPPTEADLEAFLQAHVDDYRVDPRATFLQVYVSSDRRGSTAERDANDILAELRASGRPPGQVALEVGDPIPLPRAFEDAGQREIASAFGPGFAAAVVSLEPQEWSGPIRSGYGLHLVYVEERQSGREPTLDEARGAVTRDILFQRRNDMDAALFESLRERYEIQVEYPEYPDGMTSPSPLR